jgi:small subunit ribosomal protein S7
LEKGFTECNSAVEVRSRRIGGATFQIPTEVRADRKISLSMKWLIRYSRERNGKTMADKLANEIWQQARAKALLLKRKKILIVWQKLTKLSPTLKYKEFRNSCEAPH